MARVFSKQEKEGKLSSKYNDKKLLKRGNMYKYNGKGGYKMNVIKANEAISRRTHKTKEVIEGLSYFMILVFIICCIWMGIDYLSNTVM